MKTNKLMITCALCGGGTTRKQSPYVPLTPEELVADSLAAVRAGACILHIHVRDDEGANTMETSRFVQVVSMIREALRTNHLDAIINVTTSGTKFSEDMRVAHLPILMPNIEYEYHPGQKYVDFIISFKGCGAELGNAMQIMTTAKLGKNLSGLKRFILETAVNAGGKPCPPYGIGIGIGGQMDIAAKLSRKAISTRRWDDVNPDPELAALEAELKDAINGLGLGAAGTGGDTVCLALKMERAHTHTAIAPVAINFHCWVARRAGIRIYDDGRVEKLL